MVGVPEIGRESVGRVVRDRDRLVELPKAPDRADRPEGLLPEAQHVGRAAVEDGRCVEPVGEPVERDVHASVTQRAPRSRASATCWSTFAIAASSISGPRVTPSSVPRPTTIAATAAQSIDERRVDGLLDEKTVRRDARLATVPELAGQRSRDGGIEVRSLGDDERRVPSELEGQAGEIRAEAWTRIRPTSVEPVKETLRTRGLASSSPPTTAGRPVTMLSAPGGSLLGADLAERQRRAGSLPRA